MPVLKGSTHIEQPHLHQRRRDLADELLACGDLVEELGRPKGVAAAKGFFG